MIAINASVSDLEEALRLTNEKYAGNITFNRYPEQIRDSLRFTLRVRNSKGAGARLGFTGRHLINACWHAHGDFFEALFKIRPDARLLVSSPDAKVVITVAGGNWEDRNIGSRVSPLMFSEACECVYREEEMEAI